jgi:hypothetical protein
MKKGAEFEMESRKSLVSPVHKKNKRSSTLVKLLYNRTVAEMAQQHEEEKSEICILIRVSIYGLLRKARQRLTLDATTIHDRTS